MPTWYLPSGPNKSSGILKPGLIKNSNNFNKITKSDKNSKSESGGKEIWNPRSVKNVTKFMNFGLIKVPAIGTWKKFGKNFPNGKGLNIGKSFTNKINSKWGPGTDSLVSGTLGREFGPGKVGKIYSNKYFNNIRMAYPGGDLDTALRTNLLAYTNTHPSTRKSVPGMIYNSPNPQFVGFNNLPGKLKRSTRSTRSTKFGSDFLYNQMGPPFGHLDSDYLVNKNTFKKLYGGGVQFPLKRPKKVKNTNLWIGQTKSYKPLSRNIMNR